MPYGTLRAKFYDTSYTLTGTIDDVVDAASGIHKKNKAARDCFCLLPHQITQAQRDYIVTGGLCLVTLDVLNSSGVVTGTKPVTCFVVKKDTVEQRGNNSFIRVSGDGKLSILEKRIGIIYLTHQETGTATATSINTITLAAGTADRTGWTVGAPTDPTQQVVIDSHDTGTQVATLATDWPLGAPSATTTYLLHQALAATDEFGRIRTELEPFVNGGWTLEVQDSHGGTANGTYNVVKQDSTLKALQLVQQQAGGEYFLAKNPFDTSLVTKWQRTAPASGVTFTSDKALAENSSYALVVAGSTVATRNDRAWARVFPTGAGFGASALTLSAATITPGSLYSGFTLVNVGEAIGISNGNIETSAYQPAAQKVFPEIQPANDVATQNTAAANGLMRAACYWLNQNQGTEWEYKLSCYTTADLLPGQTAAISWTDPGQNSRTITASGLYIQSVRRRVFRGQLITDVTLTETLEPSETAQEANDRHIATSQSVIRRANATVGTAASGGGAIGAHDHAYLPLSGGALTGAVTTSSTIDGRDVATDGATLDTINSSYVAQTRSIATTSPLTGGGTLASDLTLGITLTASDVPTHDIISKHSYGGGGGAALDVVGLSDATTVAKLTPSANVTGGASSLLRSDTGKLSLAQLGIGTTPATNHGLTINKSWTDVDYASGAGVESTHSVENGYPTGYAYLVTGIMSVNSGTASALQANFTQSLFGGGGGTLGSLVGTFSRNGIINASPTGTITNSTGFQIDSFANLASGTPSVSITNATGLQIRNQGAMPGGVTVDTAIGLDIYTQTGASSSNLALRTGAGHVIFNNATDANTYMWVYGDDGNPAMIVRDRKVAIGGLWAANEALEVNGNVRLTGTGSTATVNTGTGPLILDPATNVQLSGDGATPGTGAAIESDHFTSQSRGWRMTYGGDLDARYIYTDELRAEFFTAAVTQAFNGSIILTKSIGELNGAMTTAGDYITYSTEVALKVQDLAGWSGYAVFGEGDYVRMRHMDTSGGGLSFGDVWGTVHSYTDNSDGTQTWQWRQTYPTGSGGVGLSVPVGSQVLDYGESGDGIWKATTLDRGNSPYSQYSTWSAITDGKPVETVKARVGNLAGIAGVGGAYGIWAGQDPAGPRLVATDSGIEVHGGRISAYEGGDGGELRLRGIRLIVTHGGGTAYFETDGDNETSARWTNSSTETAHDQVQLAGLSTSKYAYNPENTSGYIWFDMENTPVGFNAPTAVTAQANITNSSFTTDKCAIVVQVFQSDKVTPITSPLEIANETTATQDTWAFGWTDESVGYLEWNDAVLLVTWKYRIVSSTKTIQLDPSVPSLSIGNPLPTGVATGDGIWMGLHTATSTYRFRVGDAVGPKLLWDANNLKLFDGGGNESIVFSSSGDASIDGVLELGTDGGIWQGTGNFSSPTTGLKMSNSGGIGVLEGYNAGTLQATFNSSGKLTAGGGVTTLDANGISVEASTSYSATRAYRLIDSSANLTGTLDAQVPSPAVTSITRLKTHPITGRDSQVHVFAESASGENAFVTIEAIDGTNDGAALTVNHDVVTVGRVPFSLAKLSSNPANPSTGEANEYIKDTKRIIQYNDGGTIRYKYLDLSGTGVTWVHTTTAP